MNDLAHFFNVLVEQAKRIGMVSIMPSTVSSHCSFQRFEIHIAACIGWNLHNLHPIMPAEAGFVPCAESGMSILMRFASPRDL